MAQRELNWFRLRFPAELTAEDYRGLFRSLAAGKATPLVLEVVGSAGWVEHLLGVPKPATNAVLGLLRTALPNARIEERQRPARQLRRARRIGVTTRRRTLSVEHPDISIRAVLAALAGAGERETLLLQWILGVPVTAVAVPNKPLEEIHESLGRALLLAPFQAPQPMDIERRNALREKHSEPGWRAVGRIAVAATSESRAQNLLRSLEGALRSAEAPGIRLRFRGERVDAVSHASTPWRWPLTLQARELVSVAGWPAAGVDVVGVASSGSRLLPAAASVLAKGRDARVLADATYPGITGQLSLPAADALQHLHVMGPTGVGKSTLLLNLICADIVAGRSVVVIEPKGDLIADVLARVPAHRLDDVVVLDPTDDELPVGLNPLQHAWKSERARELAADQVLAVFKGLYADSWGPRLQDILTAALLTLGTQKGATLVGLPLLLSDERYRRKVVGGLQDRLVLGPFWAWYDNLSEAERSAAIAPVMNKLRAFLLRPRLRRAVGQAAPRFDVSEVFTGRKILLVSLAKGLLGPETTGLLGSLVVSQVWQATLARAAIAPERRHPVMLFIDEFQDYLHLPTDLADVLAQARGLGVGLSLAHQHMGQLTPKMQADVLANARSRVCFQLGARDAGLMAKDSNRISPADFMTLEQYEIYASLMSGNTSFPWASGKTLKPSPACSDPAGIRAASRACYGVARATIEADLSELGGLDQRANRKKSKPGEQDDQDVIGERRRRP